jgi:putative SOS response-associated peptidase YedK
MCGRFNVESDPLSRLLLELVRLRHPGPDNHNAAPTENIVVLRLGEGGAPELVPMRWWLTPYWAKEVGTRYAMFNARSETLASSRAFREPFRRRRCVVPVSGFYEWCRRTEGGAAGGKVPYYIRPQAADGLLLAGIWDRWRDAASDTVLESFAIVTTPAADAMAFVHNRQPVMLSLEDARGWLDGGTCSCAISSRAAMRRSSRPSVRARPCLGRPSARATVRSTRCSPPAETSR